MLSLRLIQKPIPLVIMGVFVLLYCTLLLSNPALTLYSSYLANHPEQPSSLLTSVQFILLIITYQLVFFWFLLLGVWWFRVWGTLVLVSGAVVYHFTSAYGVCVDEEMLTIVANVSSQVAGEMVSFEKIWFAMVYGVVPSVFLWILPIKPITSWKARLGVVSLFPASVILFLVMLWSFGSVRNIVYEIKHRVNCALYPANVAKGSYRMYKNWYEVQKIEKTQRVVIAPDARFTKNDKKDEKDGEQLPQLVLLVIGETARSSNHSLGGYARKTNPLLEKQNVTYFSDAYSCGTYTLLAVPCIFSEFGTPDRYKRSMVYSHENIMQLFKRLAIDVYWLANNKLIPPLVHTIPAKKIYYKDFQEPWCLPRGCYDSAFITDIEQRIITNKDLPERSFLVYHLLGNHFAYDTRVPEERRVFKPGCDASNFSDCSRESIINSYDNAIRYTDFVLNGIIEKLQSRSSSLRSAVIYVSDHGESLGESGVYFHGLPNKLAPKEQLHIPFFIWMSNSMREYKNISLECLAKKTEQRVYYENLFHSLFTLYGIESATHNPEKDLLVGCITQ